MKSWPSSFKWSNCIRRNYPIGFWEPNNSNFMCPNHHNRPNIIFNIQPKTVRGICYNYVSIGSDYLVILFLELNLYFVAQYTFSTNPLTMDRRFGAKKQVKTPIAISKEFWYFILVLHNTKPLHNRSLLAVLVISSTFVSVH